MEKQSLFSDIKRKKILTELEREPKRFVELKKIIKIQSNLLSYNLKILIKEEHLDAVSPVFYVVYKIKVF